MIQVGTLGDKPEEHLLMLTVPCGLNNFSHFGGGKLDADFVAEPQDARTGLNARQCIFAVWLYALYVHLDTNDAVSHGPANNYELHSCPISLRNRMPRPITVLQAYLYHGQMDFPTYNQSKRRMEEHINAVWSPLADDPEHPDGVHLEFSFDMACTRDVRHRPSRRSRPRPWTPSIY